MLSKEQADVIGDELLNKARGSNDAQDSILRRYAKHDSAKFIFLAISIPQFFNAWLHHQKEIPDLFYFFSIALLCFSGIVAIVVGVYQRITPLIRIEDNVALYYGSVPWKKKTFLLLEINSVILTINPSLWRGAYPLSIQVNGAEHCVWLPIGKPSPVPLIQQMLSANFKDKFIVSEI